MLIPAGGVGLRWANPGYGAKRGRQERKRHKMAQLREQKTNPGSSIKNVGDDRREEGMSKGE